MEPRASGRVERAMHLVTLLLPLRRNDGAPQPPGLIASVRRELVERFGGVTAFTRAPAEGEWAEDGGGTGGPIARDEVIAVEVLVDTLDRDWWGSFRERLEQDFAQDEVLIRAAEIVRL